MFSETVADGVSYELVRSIADMVSTGETEIGIGTTHSEMAGAVETVIAFEPVEVPVLRRVETLLVRTAEPQRAVISGQVTLLKREDDDPKFRLVGINVESGTDARKVRVRLTAEQHELALHAYHDSTGLSVEGRLEREGNTYWLYDAENVREVDLAANGDDTAVGDSVAVQDPFQFPGAGSHGDD